MLYWLLDFYKQHTPVQNNYCYWQEGPHRKLMS